jgi:hypothetical protein
MFSPLVEGIRHVPSLARKKPFYANISVKKSFLLLSPLR